MNHDHVYEVVVKIRIQSQDHPSRVARDLKNGVLNAGHLNQLTDEINGPTVTEVLEVNVDVGSSEEHPAFGTVVFHRLQGNPGRLFGSRLENHATFIELEIHRAVREHDLSQDWIFPRKLLARVQLSGEQFTTLLTTMQAGEGTPCTIKFIDGGWTPDLPQDHQTEQTKILQGFWKAIADWPALIETRKVEVLELLTKAKVPKKVLETVTRVFDNLHMEAGPNTKFVLEQFLEATGKLAVEAKIEVESFVTTSLIKLGLQHLQKDVPPLLPPGPQVPVLDAEYEEHNE